MSQVLPQLELMRSETFPYPEQFAVGVSPLGTLAYFDTGAPEVPGPPAPPLVLLHALGTNYTHWEYVLPELAQKTRVIGLDLPGCGHSERPHEPYRLAQLVEAVLSFIDHLHLPQRGPQRPVLVGHSFGGRVALELALAHKERFLGLVLMNSAGLIRYPAIFETLGRHLLRPPVVGTMVLGLAPLFLRRIFAESSPRAERFIIQVFDRIETRVAYDFANHACPLLPDLVSDVIDRLPDLNLPVQVLWGDKDALLAFRKVEPALRRLPNVSIVQLPRCGHMPNFENPEAVSATILRFLEQLRIQSAALGVGVIEEKRAAEWSASASLRKVETRRN